ncbi:MAG: DUF1501 domain-containing protein [Deltaproteobacteria bacterium]|nr:DUF1501 domain-containing protein [Deltaproteobacteria bacterium]
MNTSKAGTHRPAAAQNGFTRRGLLRLAGSSLGLALAQGLLPGVSRASVESALETVSFSAPARRPTYIHVFLYGGPSELGGNLTNLADIQAASLNLYPTSQVTATANGFWEQAGGAVMENLVASGDMSVYRTIYRRKDDNKGHDKSIVQNLNGNLDINGPGFAATLAAILTTNGVIDPDTATLPVISMAGESQVFSMGDLELSPVLRPVSMDSSLNNPYSRENNSALPAGGDETLDQLADLVGNARGAFRHRQALEAFNRRRVLADFIATLDVNNVPAGVSYPANNPAADRLRAAVAIAAHNPDTFFINLGNAGLGGWDAHSQAIPTYTRNMTLLMEALQAAMAHLKATGMDDRVIINVFGDFGRNVNLNDSQGWDHGNNQNLFTLGGRAYRSLGRVVGTTELTGSSANNRLFTAPTSGSEEYEPFSIASTLLGYFGVRNPEVLTGEPVMT